MASGIACTKTRGVAVVVGPENDHELESWFAAGVVDQPLDYQEGLVY
jgi:hypothetical protein